MESSSILESLKGAKKAMRTTGATKVLSHKLVLIFSNPSTMSESAAFAFGIFKTMPTISPVESRLGFRASKSALLRPNFCSRRKKPSLGLTV